MLFNTPDTEVPSIISKHSILKNLSIEDVKIISITNKQISSEIIYESPEAFQEYAIDKKGFCVIRPDLYIQTIKDLS